MTEPFTGDRAGTELGGRVLIEPRAAGVILYKMIGHLDGSFVPQFAAAAAAEVTLGHKVDLFFDTEQMTGHEPSFRRAMTDWHNALKPETRTLNVFVRSRIIAMSIAVVNMFTGGMLKSYASRVAFEAALRAAIARARQ